MSLHHVALETRDADVEAELRFWHVLGFDEVDPPAGLDGRTRWVQRDGLQIHLLLTDAPVVPAQGHVAVVAAEYGRALEALHVAGIETQDRPRHWGATRCFATSPGGHRVEVMAYAPPT